jgi:hypothetical protein
MILAPTRDAEALSEAAWKRHQAARRDRDAFEEQERRRERLASGKIHPLYSTLKIDASASGAAGAQTLTLWAVDSPLVYQKVILSQLTLPESYLGPPATLAR